MKRFSFNLLLLILICGCTFQTKHRGYVFPDNLDTQVAGIKTKQLEEKFGVLK